MYNFNYIGFVFASIIFHICYTQSISQQKCEQYNRQRGGINRVQIIGGQRTLLSEFPHMVALGYGTIDQPRWNCGGILISDNFVLTAAHCVYSRQDGNVRFIRAGTTKLSNPESTYRDYWIAEVTPHPNYKYPEKYHDIALLRLNTTVTFSPQIKVACLDNNVNVNGSNSSLTVIGWGRLENRTYSDTLMKVNLMLYEYNTCKKFYAQDERKLPEGIREDLMICAGGKKNEKKDTCFGDSGGPLQILNETYIIVGVTSFGRSCGKPNVPSIYTKVSNYVNWIEHVVWK